MCVCVSDEIVDTRNNPFRASGELHRKADFIIAHSRISRTELQIADPDHLTSNTSSGQGPGRPHDSVDGALKPALTSSASSHQHHTRHDDVTTVVTMTSAVASTSTAEKVAVNNKKKRCLLQ